MVVSEAGRWPPLVGRNVEVRRMREIIRTVATGNGYLVLVSGEAGIGKTRLANEIAGMAGEADFLCLNGRCLPGPSFPHLPFADALSDLHEDVEAFLNSHPKAIGRRTIDSIQSWEGILQRGMVGQTEDHRLSNDRVFSEVLENLRGISSIAPILLVLDDFQWADSGSVNLLRFLARNVGRMKMLVLVLYRSEEVIDGSPLSMELNEVLGSPRGKGTYEEMRLRPLDRCQIAHLSSVVLEDEVHEELVDYLDQRTDGNPLFMVELLRTLSALDDLYWTSDGLRLNQEHKPQVPSTIQEVVMRRMDMLPKKARRVLEAASIIPEAFDPCVLGGILGLSLEQLEAQVRFLMDDYDFVIYAEGMVQFSHELVRQIVQDSISKRRRAQLHLEMGNALEKDAQPPIYGKLAQHFCIASDDAKCLKYSFLAGQTCLIRCAWKESVPYLEKSLQLLGKKGDENEKSRTILEGLGDAERELGNIQSSADYYTRLLEARPGDLQRARGLRKSAEIWVQGGLEGGIDEAMRKLDLAESMVDEDHPELAEINWSRATILFSAGRFQESEAMFHKAERLMIRLRMHDRLAWEMTHHATVHLTLAHVKESLALLEKAQRIYATNPYPSAEVELHLLLGESYLYSGEEEDALREFASCIARSDALGFYHFSRWSHFYRALILLNRGEKSKALKEIENCQKLEEHTRTPHSRLVPCMLAAHLMVSTGQLGKAEAHLKEGMKLLDDYKLEVRTPIRGLTIAVFAELLSAKGRHQESISEFERALELLSDVWGGLFFEALVREWYAVALLEAECSEGVECQIRRCCAIHRQLGNLRKAEELESYIARLHWNT